MRTVAIDLYRFSELSEAARKVAIKWYRSACNCDSSWSEFVISDFITICQLMGITTTTKEIFFCGFCSQGDGASFTGTFSYTDDIEHKIRAYAPQDKALIDIAIKLDELYSSCGSCADDISGRLFQRGYYCHSNTMYLNFTCDVELTAIPSDFYTSLLTVFRSLADWLYDQLEQEYYRYMSDEHIAYLIEANSYEFEADGRISHEYRLY